jgi:PAS domain S-box-containing protein
MTGLLERAWTIRASMRRADVLDAVAEAGAALVPDGFVLVWLARGDRLALRAAAGRLLHPHTGVPLQARVGEGLVGGAAVAPEILVVEEPAGDPRACAAAFLRAEAVRAFVGVPLAGRYGLEGVLGVFSRRPGAPDPGAREQLAALASQAALALESGRLFAAGERRRRAAEALAAVGQALAHSLDPREVAHLIADSVLTLLDARDVVVYRLDRATGELLSIAFAGEGAAGFSHPLVLAPGTGVSGRAVLERTPVLTADVLGDPRLVYTPEQRRGFERAGYRAAMAVPLLVHGEPIGSLGVAAAPGRAFDEEAGRLLEAFADQAAVALSTARLFEAERAARTRAEAAERRVHELVQGVDAIVTELDRASRRVLFVNGRIEPLLGYTAEQWLNEPGFWRAHIHPDDRPRVVDFMTAEIDAGRDAVQEYRMLAADGRVVWLRDSVTVGADRVRTLKIDITARKRTEALLSGESRVLTLIAGGEPLPRVLGALCRILEEQDPAARCSVLLVEEGRLRSVAGPRLAEACVPVMDGLDGDTWRQPVVVEDFATDPRGASCRAVALAHGLRAGWFVPIRDTADANLATLALYYAAPHRPTPDDHRLVARVAGLAAIAIERTRAQQALQASEQRYRMLITSIPDVAWLVDHAGHALFLSPHVERVGGYTAEEIQGAGPAGWFGRIHPDDAPLVRRAFEAMFETGELFDLQYRLQHRNGRWVWVHDRAVTTYEEHGVRYAWGLYADITHRKHAEEIRALLLNQVITVQEEERRRIARELHDETAQSLASLALGLSALQEARTLGAARAQARELHQVVTRALAEVRRLAWGLRPSVLDDLGLAAALGRYVEEFGRTRGIDVEVDAGGLGDARLPAAVETALFRIMQEALSNVARHAGARRVHVALARFGVVVAMVITDDGCGFDPQRAAAPASVRHGLGIHTMRERAVVLNGTFELESAAGRGTRITVEIPLPGEPA